VITPQLLKAIVPLAKRYKKPVAVDPKEEHFTLYKGVTLITPNVEEASKATGIKISGNSSINAIGRKLLRRLRCRTALVTLGEKGMALFNKSKRPVYIPTVAQEVYDVSGAGDTVIGTFSLALASGASDIEAAHIANCAAGIVVGKIGIAVITAKELTERIKEEAEK
jgi:D-beta-D-heptose 7-phosphate kinase/D-beta-D-heptose 1-phosphate adenosyltransferase